MLLIRQDILNFIFKFFLKGLKIVAYRNHKIGRTYCNPKILSLQSKHSNKIHPYPFIG